MWGRTQRAEGAAARLDDGRNDFLMGASTLVANRVYDGDGNLVGKLEEIVIDTRTGCIRHAVLSVGGVLGVGKRRFAIPWSALAADPGFRRCNVDLKQMQLTALPVPGDDPWLQRSSPDRSARAFDGASRLFGMRA